LGNLLTIKDIEILNDGQQIRKTILKDYCSIDDFYQQNNIIKPSLKSFKSYLSSNKVSDTFQILMVNLLKQSWSDIVKTEEEQMQYLVYLITKDINLYTKNNDLEMLEKLKNICKPHKVLYAIQYRNIGLYFYNTFRYSDAVVCMLLAIEILSSNCEEYDLIIEFYTDLLKVCFHERIYDKTKKLYAEINTIVTNNNINPELLYKLWYVLGQLYRNNVEDKENTVLATTMFYRALKLAETNIQKGNTYLQIGLIYKNNSDFKNTLKYYKLAQEFYEPNDVIRQGIVLNNLAEIYKLMGKKHEALFYIEEALHMINNEDITDRKLIFLTTKLEIVDNIDDYRVIIKDIERILLLGINKFGKKFVITSIDTLIEIAEKINENEINESLISVIEKIIYNFAQETNQSNYLHNNFVQTLENQRNKMIYINNKNKEDAK
jgi:tetratricopeptide (TPR) repeat protein